MRSKSKNGVSNTQYNLDDVRSNERYQLLTGQKLNLRGDIIRVKDMQTGIFHAGRIYDDQEVQLRGDLQYLARMKDYVGFP